MAWSVGEMTAAAGLVLGGYLVGAIPFGLVVGLARGVDVRKSGSGNIGATNVGRVLGRPWGFLVFALDMLKGLVPTALAGAVIARYLWPGVRVSDEPAAAMLWIAVAAACIIGHMFPVYLRFRGGKGVATSLGVLLGIYPYFTLPVLVAFGLWIVLTLVTRYVSVGSVAAATAFPIIFALVAWYKRRDWGDVQSLWPMYLFGVVLAALVVYRHRGNLKRLTEGTEPRIGSVRHRA
jgi:glycerol-3-phosphate acyltransferase PlsY